MFAMLVAKCWPALAAKIEMSPPACLSSHDEDGFQTRGLRYRDVAEPRGHVDPSPLVIRSAIGHGGRLGGKPHRPSDT